TPGTPKSNETARKPRRRRGASDERGAASRVDREKLLLWARFAGYGLVVLAFLGVLAWWALTWSGKKDEDAGKKDEDERTSSPRASTFVPRGPGRPGGPQQPLFNLSA